MKKKKVSWTRWMHMYGDHLLSLTYCESELKRIRCALKCNNKYRNKDALPTKLVKVRITASYR